MLPPGTRIFLRGTDKEGTIVRSSNEKEVVVTLDSAPTEEVRVELEYEL